MSEQSISNPAESRISYTQPVSITLTKGQRQSYGWEISIRGEDVLSVLQRIYVADGKLRARYGRKEVEA